MGSQALLLIVVLLSPTCLSQQQQPDAGAAVAHGGRVWRARPFIEQAAVIFSRSLSSDPRSASVGNYTNAARAFAIQVVPSGASGMDTSDSLANCTLGAAWGLIPQPGRPLLAPMILSATGSHPLLVLRLRRRGRPHARQKSSERGSRLSAGEHSSSPPENKVLRLIRDVRTLVCITVTNSRLPACHPAVALSERRGESDPRGRDTPRVGHSFALHQDAQTRNVLIYNILKQYTIWSTGLLRRRFTRPEPDLPAAVGLRDQHTGASGSPKP